MPSHARRLALLLLLALAACAPAQQRSAPAPIVTPPPPQAPAPQANPGSLFDPAQADFLFSDNRARRVGDIVLVNIVEASKGTHKADTTAERESEAGFGISSMFGKDMTRLTPVGPSFGLKGDVGASDMVGATSSNTFDGKGETTREANVTATVAARVVSVMPGGVLQIEGGREIKVNSENQILVVRGLIRTRDIRPDNSILSSYIADAHIEYYGQGVVADKQRPGWLSRIIDNIWPF